MSLLVNFYVYILGMRLRLNSYLNYKYYLYNSSYQTNY